MFMGVDGPFMQQRSAMIAARRRGGANLPIILAEPHIRPRRDVAQRLALRIHAPSNMRVRAMNSIARATPARAMPNVNSVSWV